MRVRLWFVAGRGWAGDGECVLMLGAVITPLASSFKGGQVLEREVS